MTAVPGQNATVEEILASIRQAISEDDARRTGERLRSDPHGVAERKPVASVTNIFPEETPEGEAVAAAIEPVTAEEAVTDEAKADQEFIDQAIEQALDGVRVELESAHAPAKPARAEQQHGVEMRAAAGGERAVPRAARTAVRREVPSPRRALLSPRTDAHVAASFEDLARAMMGGNAVKLDEVVVDLLKPMLKNWLENNLPQMVERLVREEIERVSRGPR
jgi:cell pole-organizing protein PopZ